MCQCCIIKSFRKAKIGLCLFIKYAHSQGNYARAVLIIEVLRLLLVDTGVINQNFCGKLYGENFTVVIYWKQELFEFQIRFASQNIRTPNNEIFRMKMNY